mgnify:CR=1 FL=1
MKVLFLDVDGVLNTASLIESDGINAVGEEFLQRLDRIIKETKVEVVLSSTWRLYPKAKNVLEEKLKEKNIFLLDSTIEIRRKLSARVSRSEEIAEWLTRHPKVDKFAIVDDNDDAGEYFPSSFFQTTFQKGLTEEVTENIIQHLN